MKRTYGDGETIFKEGEPSDAAYVVVEGRVDLSRRANGTESVIASLGVGEMFGEMGLFDRAPRAATARAVGAATAEVIPAEAFLGAPKGKQNPTTGFFGRLLRGAARPQPGGRRNDGADGAGTGAEGSTGRRFIGRLVGVRGVLWPERIGVRVASFAGDHGGTHTRHLVAALERRRGIRVRFQGETIPLDPAAPIEARAPMAAEIAREYLDAGGDDLMIWGEVDEQEATISVRFIGATPEDEDAIGYFGPTTSLDLPVGFGPKLAHALYAVGLCAADPDTEGKELMLRDVLADAVAVALEAVQATAGELTSGERASLGLCLGNAAAAAAEFRADDGFLTVAAEGLRETLATIPENAGPYVRGVATRNLGAVLHAIAERQCDEDMLNECARLYRDAMTVFTRQGYPSQWSALQNRLGLVLLRLDRATGGTELVKEALAAFQAALQIRKRAADPLKWAEVMNNVGQAALLLGGQLRSAEALEKAATACRGALEERTRERMPVAWAATQNNLGSALFLIGKLRREMPVVEAAAAALDEARAVCVAHGAASTAALVDKNLVRVHALIEELTPKEPPPMAWEPVDRELTRTSLAPTVAEERPAESGRQD
ncbi:MAG: cyclic nucleotide-binding domain-containing protein [Rhodospirillales bacterium]|nr:cyclic nucleotide-binding domain-containing protein [Rhodospirillales bacterium]